MAMWAIDVPVGDHTTRTIIDSPWWVLVLEVALVIAMLVAVMLGVMLVRQRRRSSRSTT